MQLKFVIEYRTTPKWTWLLLGEQCWMLFWHLRAPFLQFCNLPLHAFLPQDKKISPDCKTNLEMASQVHALQFEECVCVSEWVYLYRCCSRASRVDLFIFGRLSMKVEYFFTLCLSSFSSIKTTKMRAAWGTIKLWTVVRHTKGEWGSNFNYL